MTGHDTPRHDTDTVEIASIRAADLSSDVPAKDLGKHAIWIYGVIVGLAIREAITATFDHQRTDPHPYHQFVELARFFLFLFVASRFYLGAALFFERVHGPGSERWYPSGTKQFGLDFMIGLVHFLLFFLWAMTLVTHRIWLFGLTPALVMAWFVLLYDIFWLVVSLDLSTRDDIGTWTGLNVLTFAASVAAFVVVAAICFSWDARQGIMSTTAELIAIVPMLGFGVFDLRLLIRSDNTLPRRLAQFVQIFKS